MTTNIRWFIVTVVIIIACTLLACTPKNGGGTGPTPTSGTITVSFQPPATCLSAGSQYDRCDRIKFPVTISFRKEGYQFSGTLNSSMAVTVGEVPSGILYIIQVVDPWKCQPIQICSGVGTGEGLTVNGTKLNDQNPSTTFGFMNPPTVTR